MLDYIADAIAHAASSPEKEICGVVVIQKGRAKYFQCRNISESPVAEFIISPDDYAEAEDAGEIIKIVHSHVGIPPLPSQADLVGCELTKLPWIIVNGRTGAWNEFEPNGYEAPLVGRQYSHGVLDCFSIVRDYYRINFGIMIADYHRDWEWWLKGQNLYTDHFEKEGFISVAESEMREGDSLLIQVQSRTPNHAAVYLGNNLILHHLTNRLSSRDVYGGYFRKHTVMVLRHRSLA